MANFDTAVDLVLQHEGSKYTDDPDDAGGPTKYGITLPDLNEYDPSKKHSASDIQSLTLAYAKAVYKTVYWDKLLLSQVGDDKLAAVILDQAVLQGKGYISSLLQTLVKVPKDGIVGPATISAINSQNPKNLCLDIITADFLHYVSIVQHNGSQIEYLSGWDNRCISLLNYVFRT